MRKIPKTLENPIDNIIIDDSENISSLFYKYKLTPNFVTSMSNISALIVILFLLNSNYYFASFFVMLAYFFDCLDGHIARKYKQTSKFGDYYDHISDIIKFIAIMTTLYYINKSKFFKILPIICIFLFFSILHLGCQEIYYDTDESKTLDFTKKLCPVGFLNNEKNVNNTLNYTKYFGCGSLNIVLALCIVYYDM